MTPQRMRVFSESHLVTGDFTWGWSCPRCAEEGSGFGNASTARESADNHASTCSGTKGTTALTAMNAAYIVQAVQARTAESAGSWLRHYVDPGPTANQAMGDAWVDGHREGIEALAVRIESLCEHLMGAPGRFGIEHAAHMMHGAVKEARGADYSAAPDHATSTDGGRSPVSDPHPLAPTPTSPRAGTGADESEGQAHG